MENIKIMNETPKSVKCADCGQMMKYTERVHIRINKAGNPVEYRYPAKRCNKCTKNTKQAPKNGLD